MLWPWLIVVFAGGFIAGAIAWPWVRLKLQGAKAEATALRDRAKAIEQSWRGKL